MSLSKTLYLLIIVLVQPRNAGDRLDVTETVDWNAYNKQRPTFPQTICDSGVNQFQISMSFSKTSRSIDAFYLSKKKEIVPNHIMASLFSLKQVDDKIYG